MSTELDNGTVRELSSKFENLSLVVMELKTDVKNMIAQSIPMLRQQADGITNHDNRLTRLEEQVIYVRDRERENRIEYEGKLATVMVDFTSKIAAVEKSRADDKEAAAKQQERQTSTNRFLLTFCLAAMSTVVGLIVFAINHVRFK